MTVLARRSRRAAPPPKIGDFVWHIHHNTLCDLLTEPLARRRAYIKGAKPANEIETRLKWMTPVRGRLPAAYVKARAAYDKAWAAYDKAWAAEAEAASDKARAAYDKAWAAYLKPRAAYDKARVTALPALERLHAKEHVGCPWNGKTLVFPKVGS